MTKWANVDAAEYLTKEEWSLDEDITIVTKKEPPDIITLDDDDSPDVLYDEPSEQNEDEVDLNDPFTHAEFLSIHPRNRRAPHVITLDDSDEDSMDDQTNGPKVSSLDIVTFANSTVVGFRRLAEFLKLKGLEEPEPQPPFIPTSGDYDMFFDAMSREMARLYPGQRERSQDDIHIRYNFIEADLNEFITKKSFKKLKKKFKRGTVVEEPKKRKKKQKKAVPDEEVPPVAAEVTEDMQSEEPSVEAVAETVVEGEPVHKKAVPEERVPPVAAEVTEDMEIEEPSFEAVAAVSEPFFEGEPVVADHRVEPEEPPVAEADVPMEEDSEPLPSAAAVALSPIAVVHSRGSSECPANEEPTFAPVAAPTTVVTASVDDVVLPPNIPAETGSIEDLGDNEEDELESLDLGSVKHSDGEQELEDGELPATPVPPTVEAVSDESLAGCSPRDEVRFEPFTSITVPKTAEPANLCPVENGTVAPRPVAVRPGAELPSSDVADSEAMDTNENLDAVSVQSTVSSNSELFSEAVDSANADMYTNRRAPRCDLEEEGIFDYDEAGGSEAPMSSGIGASSCSASTQDTITEEDPCNDISPIVSSSASTASFEPEPRLEGLEFTLEDIQAPEGWEKFHESDENHPDDKDDVWEKVDKEVVARAMELNAATGDPQPIDEALMRRIFHNVRTDDGRDLKAVNAPQDHLPPQLRWRQGDRPLHRVERKAPKEEKKDPKIVDQLDDDPTMFEFNPEEEDKSPLAQDQGGVVDEDDDIQILDDDDDIQILGVHPAPVRQDKAPQVEKEGSVPEAPAAGETAPAVDAAPEVPAPASPEIVDLCNDEEEQSIEDLAEVDEDGRKKEDTEKEVQEAQIIERQESPEIKWRLVPVIGRRATGISRVFAAKGFPLPNKKDFTWPGGNHKKIPSGIPLHLPMANRVHMFDLGRKTMFGIPMEEEAPFVTPSVSKPSPPKKVKKRKAGENMKRPVMHDILGVDGTYGQHKKYINQGISLDEQWDYNMNRTVGRREEELQEKGIIVSYDAISLNNFSFPFDPFAGAAWPIFQPTDGVQSTKEHQMDQADVRNQLTDLSICSYIIKGMLLCDYKEGTWDTSYEEGRRCRTAEDMKKRGRFQNRVGYARKICTEDLEEAKRRDMEKQERERREMEKIRKEMKEAEEAPQESGRLNHIEAYCRDGRMDSYVNATLYDNYSLLNNHRYRGYKLNGARKPSTLPYEWFNMQRRYYIPVNDRRFFLCEYVNYYNQDTTEELEKILKENKSSELPVDRLVHEWQLPVIQASYALQAECSSQLRMAEEDGWEAKRRLTEIKNKLHVGGMVRLADVKKLAKLQEWEYKYWSFIWDNLCSIYRTMPPVVLMIDDLRDVVGRVFKRMAPDSQREAFYQNYERHREKYMLDQRAKEVREREERLAAEQGHFEAVPVYQQAYPRPDPHPYQQPYPRPDPHGQDYFVQELRYFDRNHRY